MSIRRHMSTARQYELVYIAPPEITEDALAELHQQVAAVVERFGGNIEKTENWGRRKLAYEINHQREGVYVLEVINGPGAHDRRARSPSARRRSGHPPHDRARRRGAGDRRAARRRIARRGWPRGACKRGLPPEPTESEFSRRRRKTMTWTRATCSAGTAAIPRGGRHGDRGDRGER